MILVYILQREVSVRLKSFSLFTLKAEEVQQRDLTVKLGETTLGGSLSTNMRMLIAVV